MEKVPTFKILITGVESSGKSTLASAIQARYGGMLVSEYARTYSEENTDAIRKEDVIYIGDVQLKEYDSYQNASDLVIFDTNILTTVIWLKDKYKTRLMRFQVGLASQKYDLVFLCYPDLVWKDDGIREDGHRLMILHKRYVTYLEKYNFRYFLILGEGIGRDEIAFREIDKKMSK